MRFKDYYDRAAYGRDLVIDNLKRDKAFMLSDLQLIVTLKTGLGEKWLRDFVEILKKTGHISQDGDYIKWLNKGVAP